MDTRSDIFSLGVVFYETLTGRRPFEGSNPASVLSSILRDTPRPVTELQPAVPRALARLVRSLSRQEPRRSLSVGARSASQPGGGRSRTSTQATRLRSPVPLPGPPADHGAECDARGRGRTRGRHRRVARLRVGRSERGAVPQVRNPVQLTSALDVESYPTWSPDGQRLAYQASESSSGLSAATTSGSRSSGAASR